MELPPGPMVSFLNTLLTFGFLNLATVLVVLDSNMVASVARVAKVSSLVLTLVVWIKNFLNKLIPVWLPEVLPHPLPRPLLLLPLLLVALPNLPLRPRLLLREKCVALKLVLGAADSVPLVVSSITSLLTLLLPPLLLLLLDHLAPSLAVPSSLRVTVSLVMPAETDIIKHCIFADPVTLRING